MIKLLTTALVGVHNLKDVCHRSLSLDERLQHVNLNAMLCDGQALARLAVGGIIGTKTLGIDGVDMCHKDASNVDRMFSSRS